jgi:hypothetical protein
MLKNRLAAVRKGASRRRRNDVLHTSKSYESPADRAGRYLRMADQVRDLAWRASGAEIKEAYLDLAMQWVFLADEARRERRAANEA